MFWYHWVLLSAATGAALLAWNVPRAVQWLCCGALSFVLSAMWHRAGWPYATAFGASTNLVICYLFWIFADQRWEMRLWNAFHAMLLVDLLYIFGAIGDHLTFAISLEFINLAAILLVAGTGIAERASGFHSRPAHRRGTGFIYHTLWAARSVASRPWWQKR